LIDLKCQHCYDAALYTDLSVYDKYVQGGSLNRGKNGTDLLPLPVLGCEGRNYYNLIGWDPSAGKNMEGAAGGGITAAEDARR
jgi:hypothetical protein